MIKKVHEITSGVSLIGIHGKAGAGKDAICLWLSHNYKNIYREAFAIPLKEACAKAFGVPVDFFNDADMKEMTDPFWNVSYRKMAQFFGTEMFRDIIGGLLPDDDHDFWIRRLTGTLNNELTGADENQHGSVVGFVPGDTICITDVRFPNEAEWILSNGGHLITVRRDGREGTVGFSGHVSEAGIGENISWLIENNGTLEELYDEVDKFAKHIGLTPLISSESIDNL